MLIDTHAHLTDPRYTEDRNAIIENLKENRVEKVFCVAFNKESIKEVYELSQKYPNIYAIIGIHPDEIQDYDAETISLIKEYSHNSKVIGIGEIGLDYHTKNDNKEEQARIFVEQLKLAHELKLPVCIHNRDSIGDMLKILKANAKYLEFGGVMHCFSESVESYDEVVKLGLKIAFGGTLTFKNNRVAPLVCEHADIKNILLETDCPYLAPDGHRGERNEPKYTSIVAEKIAIIKGLSYDSVVEITTANALEVYKKAR